MGTPVFAERLDGSHPPSVSDAPIHRFYSKLYREYNERLDRGECECSARNFNRYVKLPTTDYMQAFDKRFNNENYSPYYTDEDFQKFTEEFIESYDFENARFKKPLK